MSRTRLLLNAVCIVLTLAAVETASSQPAPPRQKLLMDFGWRFALGHAFDTRKDFGNGRGYFSYFAKAGYGDGAASKEFDDRAWRVLDVPHDWCVELPFDSTGSFSHGYKALGRNFPENSVGWYRRHFFIPESDLGKRIAVEFEGVFRNSIVWVNGFYLGTEHSGYLGFKYDISDYLNYGGQNVVAVRVDATTEEGWFYEGAGIYRHVWLTKVAPLHVADDGTFVTTDVQKESAIVTTRTTVVNESREDAVFGIEESVLDPAGNIVAANRREHLLLRPGDQQLYFGRLKIAHPGLWSVDTPCLHTLKTAIRSGGQTVDIYQTTFGIRTVRFDPNEGFFLNGKPLKITGTNDHQDHAGVGIALPDALQEFRIRRLKEMGSNGIRTSHNPPAPALLDACDRLGMLVLDENRLMGINEEHLQGLERLMKRDRNHPCVVLWSLGNEEWAMESNIKGARIGATMQAFAKRLDSTRAFTAAISGGWDEGTGRVMQVMGFNYIVQGDIDGHHRKFPWQAGIGTEESNTGGTRGVYVADHSRAHMIASNRIPENAGTESGWKFYDARPFLSGVFYWTGFDYRGEMTPFDWPAISSQYGLLDACGFPKDTFYYLKSWWGRDPVLHIVPDWRGPAGRLNNIVVYSNCPQVELLLNDRTLGKKEMPRNGHLEWPVAYQSGMLTARGYENNGTVLEGRIDPHGESSAIQLIPDRSSVRADGEDISVVTVQVVDRNGVPGPLDSSTISFHLDGPGRIVGVGNGDPSSHEPDQFVESVAAVDIEGMRELVLARPDPWPEAGASAPDSAWRPAFRRDNQDWQLYTDSLLAIRGSFNLPALNNEAIVTLFGQSITEDQSVYVNGASVASHVERDAPNQPYVLRHDVVNSGRNEFVVVGRKFRKKSRWDTPNTFPGVVGVVSPAPRWRRSLFNGLAQVIVQSAKTPGELVLTATSPPLRNAELRIQTRKVAARAAVSAE